MTTKNLLAAILVVACSTSAKAADRPSVQSVLDEYRAVRPTAKDLAIYELDWAPTLEAAKQRAAKEKRPVLLIVVTNSFGDMYSGHC